MQVVICLAGLILLICSDVHICLLKYTVYLAAKKTVETIRDMPMVLVVRMALVFALFWSLLVPIGNMFSISYLVDQINICNGNQ